MPSIANYFFATFYSTYFFPVINKFETSGILVSLPKTTRNSVRINYTIQLEIGNFYNVTETQSLTEQVCVVVGSQRESTAFAAERRRLPQHCAHSCRSISPVCRALSSTPAGRRCCCRPTGQTDRRTDARALHRPIQRQQVRQVNNL